MATNAQYRVHVIVDTNYGDRLRNSPPGEPAWVIGSPANLPFIRELWTEVKEGSPIADITSFKFDPKGSNEDWLIGILKPIDLHHGLFSKNPPYSLLNVIGVEWSDRIGDALNELGFVLGERTPEGFVARRTDG